MGEQTGPRIQRLTPAVSLRHHGHEWMNPMLHTRSPVYPDTGLFSLSGEFLSSQSTNAQ
jgi:hypothetical protein